MRSASHSIIPNNSLGFLLGPAPEGLTGPETIGYYQALLGESQGRLGEDQHPLRLVSGVILGGDLWRYVWCVRAYVRRRKSPRASLRTSRLDGYCLLSFGKASQTFSHSTRMGSWYVETFIAEKPHFSDYPEPGGARRLVPAEPSSVG